MAKKRSTQKQDDAYFNNLLRDDNILKRREGQNPAQQELERIAKMQDKALDENAKYQVVTDSDSRLATRAIPPYDNTNPDRLPQSIPPVTSNLYALSDEEVQKQLQRELKHKADLEAMAKRTKNAQTLDAKQIDDAKHGIMQQPSRPEKVIGASQDVEKHYSTVGPSGRFIDFTRNFGNTFEFELDTQLEGGYPERLIPLRCAEGGTRLIREDSKAITAIQATFTIISSSPPI
jgi:hypothetical protein